MPRRQVIPDSLKLGPITIAEAEVAGMSRHQLRGPNWRRLGDGAARIVWAGLRGDQLVSRSPQWSAQLPALIDVPAGVVYSHRTAAALFGLDIGPVPALEVTAPAGKHVWPRPHLHVRHARLDADDVVTRRGTPLTSPVRTAFDLARSLERAPALAAVDAMLHRKIASLTGLRRYASDRRGWRGVSQARELIDLAEPDAESPKESILRLILIDGGLPRPRANVTLRTGRGEFIARPDLLYDDGRLVIEYDGDNHRDRLAQDDHRQNRLQRAGYGILRYTRVDLDQRPGEIVTEVGEELKRRPSYMPR
jgi:hypothetical protein